MIERMRWRELYIGILSIALTPILALAQSDAKPVYDGRLEGFPSNVTLDGGGVALQWLLLAFLSAIAIVVLFKNAKRSHLD
jgi:hypothetical protein